MKTATLPQVFLSSLFLLLAACSSGDGSSGDPGGDGADADAGPGRGDSGPGGSAECPFRACGDDGNGRSCGSCGGEESCSEFGQCVRTDPGAPAVVFVFDQDLHGIVRIDAEGSATLFYDESGDLPFFNSLGLLAISGDEILAANNQKEFGSGAPASVLRLRDDNGDGDALDAGEATVFFDGSLPGGYQLHLPTGLRRGTDGEIYLHENNYIGEFNPEAVYRLSDVDQSGAIDADGEVELVRELDAQGGSTVSTWETVLDASGEFYVKDNADSKDATIVHRVNASGQLSPYISGYVLFPMTEGGQNLVLAYTPGELGYHPATDEVVTVAENFGGGGPFAHLVAGRDADGSGMVDSVDEFRVLWDEAEDDSELDLNAKDFEVLEDGTIVVLGIQHIVRLIDQNGDGDMNDAGEVSLVLDGVGSGLDAHKLWRLDAILPDSGAEAPE